MFKVFCTTQPGCRHWIKVDRTGINRKLDFHSHSQPSYQAMQCVIEAGMVWDLPVHLSHMPVFKVRHLGNSKVLKSARYSCVLPKLLPSNIYDRS